MLVAAPQQQFGRPDRAGAEHHQSRRGLAGDQLPRLDAIEVDRVSASLGRD
jgi:hypothetical protein